MVNGINQLGQEWMQLFGQMILQNTIFLAVILLLLWELRFSRIKYLRWLALFGMLKLITPPINLPSLRLFQHIVSGIGSAPVGAILPDSITATDEFLISYSGFIMLTWCVITFVLFGLMMWKLVTVYRIRSRATQVDINDIAPSDPDVQVWISTEVSSPMALGYFRHHILVPDHWMEYSISARKAVVQHELAHLRQKDAWINLLQMVVTAVYFFHPLVWILSKKLNYYNEIQCDNTAIAHTSLKRNSYLQCILEVAEGTKNTILQPFPGFMKSYTYLRNRIQYHLSHSVENGIAVGNRQLIPTVLTGVLILVLSLVCVSFAGDLLAGHFEQLQVYEWVHRSGIWRPEQSEQAFENSALIVRINLDNTAHVTIADVVKPYKSNIVIHNSAVEAVRQADWQSTFQDGKPAEGRYDLTIPVQNSRYQIILFPASVYVDK